MSSTPRRVAMILAENFEDSEATSPIEALDAQGVDVTVIGMSTGTLTGKKGAKVDAVATIADSTVGDFELLIIPGGGSPENLRIDETAVDFTRDFVASGKPVASICHGPQLLISADVLSGRTVTAVNKIRDDITNAGATYVDEEVHVDGNLISSRIPDDLPAFNDALVNALGL
ncbi:type 1 glutamine amidotransferase domain-containing protein [Mobilicoccus caccae]|uniref:type 1 glutamine amidotransferase domain-containing protein n=1 Tax=Mobilicoccus caccae TaxID=1859295 RepID=UPI0024E0E819|nr:type 1 glutamine amidotransferase domain-containing protein [Mobilicoccus caccae]